MGAATSLEEIEEVRVTLSENNPSFNSTSTFTKKILKEALTSKDLSNAKVRRLRASALGRRCVCSVQVGRDGFSLQHVMLCEGQVVSFKMEDEDDDDDGEQNYRVKQVVDSGEERTDVVGGLGSESGKDHYEQQFNLAGDYHFIIEGLKKPPLLIEVHARKDIEAKVTDEGFEPRIIRLDEGNSVVWTWSDCEVPRFIREASFEADQWMMTIHKDSNVPTKSGTYKKTFNKPGMYYFQTAGLNLDERRTCIVQVRERQREYRVTVEDEYFDPQIIVVEEGDRVWWDWTKNEGDKYHCIFEANVSKDGKLEQSESGIAWRRPTKFGLISREFFQAGVYFYGDREFQKVANYVCTVIVKPAQNDHFIEVNKTGFVPDLLHVMLGDRIWFTWLIEKDEDLEDLDKYIIQLDKTTTGDLPKASPEKSGEQHMDDLLAIQKYQVGLELVLANQIGVYHHLQRHSGSTCSLICKDGSRNHTITVTDSGFEPSHLTAYLNDKVWWIWQDAKRMHSIIQVNSSGRETDGGIASGYPMFSPSAFVFQFQEAGKYHYKSPGHVDEVVGMIDIHLRPTVVPVAVGPGAMEPEPVTVATNDVVAWVFSRPTPYDVQEVNTFDDVMNAQTVPQGIPPRKCMCKLFKEPGVFHHSSRSFVDPNNRSSRAQDQQISSVIVSDPEDAVVIRIDEDGFHPPHLDLPEDDFVIFDWRETDQPQNVVEIDKDGRPIEFLDNSANYDSNNEEESAGNAIRSGEPELESSFQHYFDLSGVFRFTSDCGLPGRTCVVNVRKNVGKTDMPEIVGYENRALKVPQHQEVHLKCKDPKAVIYYTLDGGLPYLHRTNILVG